MGKKIEKLLQLLADTEGITPEDKLSEMVAEEKETELTEEMLDYVSAATGSDYERFKKFLAVEKDAADK